MKNSLKALANVGKKTAETTRYGWSLCLIHQPKAPAKLLEKKAK